MAEQSNGTSTVKQEPSHNKEQDKVFKECFDVFKGGTLDFLGIDLGGGIVEDILNTEITETTTKKLFADSALKLSDGTGLNCEWEADMSLDDMKRFASYSIDLSRKHKISFDTVIVMNKKPTITSYTTRTISFNPIIVVLSERFYDKTVEKIQSGDIANPLELIYLPMYGNTSKTDFEKLDTAVKLTHKMIPDEKQRNKIHTLLLFLNERFVGKDIIRKVMTENMQLLENNKAAQVLHEMGFEKGMEKGIEKGREEGIEKGIERGVERVAMNMLSAKVPPQQVAKMTGLSFQQLERLLEEMAVS